MLWSGWRQTHIPVTGQWCGRLVLPGACQLTGLIHAGRSDLPAPSGRVWHDLCTQHEIVKVRGTHVTCWKPGLAASSDLLGSSCIINVHELKGKAQQVLARLHSEINTPRIHIQFVEMLMDILTAAGMSS